MNRVEKVTSIGVMRDESLKSQKKLSDEFKDLLEKIASKVTIETNKAEKAIDFGAQSKVAIKPKNVEKSDKATPLHEIINKSETSSEQIVKSGKNDEGKEVKKVDIDDDNKANNSDTERHIDEYVKKEASSEPQSEDHSRNDIPVDPKSDSKSEFKEASVNAQAAIPENNVDLNAADETPENITFQEQAVILNPVQQEVSQNVPHVIDDRQKPMKNSVMTENLHSNYEVQVSSEITESVISEVPQKVASLGAEQVQDEVFISAKDLEIYFKLKDIESKQKSPFEIASQMTNPVSIQAVLQQISTSSEVVKSLAESTQSHIGLKINKESGFTPSVSAISADMRKSGVEREVRSRPLPRAHEARTMEKVESVLKEAVKAKDGKSITLRLDPPSLGAMRIDVGLKDGILHAKLIPESLQVGNFLRENAHELVISLRKLGLQVEKVTVSVVTEQGFESQEQAGSSTLQDNKGENQNHSHDARGDQGMPEAFPQDVQVVDSSNIDHWVA